MTQSPAPDPPTSVPSPATTTPSLLTPNTRTHAEAALTHNTLHQTHTAAPPQPITPENASPIPPTATTNEGHLAPPSSTAYFVPAEGTSIDGSVDVPPILSRGTTAAVIRRMEEGGVLAEGIIGRRRGSLAMDGRVVDVDVVVTAKVNGEPVTVEGVPGGEK
ncbi:hypothetical protein EJ06DRAFT_371575 [Trichodelitschia bisporula]|uniref:Uncharacterized protein n=1 Tax=Trichodelitschia bisporula TaxID=703511 RepID=A0A6G1I1Z8_9PEZI|nr:hypothetical protein EJ06DRAFT_371575 [Trichodelitschia bisporula]